MQPDHNTSNDMPLKFCYKCKERKCATTEFFHRQKRSADGLQAKCKDCCRQYRQENAKRLSQKQQQYYIENRKRIRARANAYREANRDAINLANNRYYHGNRARLLIERRQSRSQPENERKKREQDRRYREVNRDAIARRKIAYYLTNRDAIAQKTKKWQQDNPERVKAYKSTYIANNPDKRARSVRRYKLNNPGMERAQKLLRRARKASLPSNFLAEDWEYALTYFGGRCAVCERPTNGLFHAVHADHWIALSAADCPGTVPRNILPLCGGVNGCNQSKGNKPAAEWLTAKFGEHKAAAILARIEAYFETVRDG